MLRSLGKRPLSQLLKNIREGSRQLSGYVNVNDAILFYERYGINKNVVLCLPGALGTTRTDFGYQLNGMSEEFTMVSFDPRGYGKSKKNVRNFQRDFYKADAEDAFELMSKLGFEKYSVLGWSDGGIAGMILAALAPNAVHKLVIWGSNAFVSKEDEEAIGRLKDLNTWSDRMKIPLEETYGKENLEKLWHGFVDGYCRFARKPNGDICIGRLKDIKCPTFILHGVKDPMVASCHPGFLNENIKGSELYLFPEGKHNIHMRYNTEFNALVTDFLKR